MKSIKKTAYLSVLVLAISFIASTLWRHSVRSAANVQRQKTVDAVVANENSATNCDLRIATDVSSVPDSTPKTAQPNYDQINKIYQQFVNKDNAALVFFGKIVDQNDKPLSGVNITVDVLHLNVLNPSEPFIGSDTIHLERVTAADGRFEISGVKGASFSINAIIKSGFETEPNIRRTYGASGGNSSQPVVFKMWPANIHEKLITGEISVPIVPDGRPYMISFTNEFISESIVGDLKIWVKRPDRITFGQRYDWSCEITAVNGGILQETDPNSSMYVVPVEGYIPSFHFEQKIGSGWGDTTGTKRFYVQLNNGKEYGRITIELFAYYNKQTLGSIRLSYAINPSGSRILR